MPEANPGASILFKPAQSKCRWTFHKGQLTQNFTRKMPDAPDITLIEVTLAVRTLPMWPHSLGNKRIYEVHMRRKG